MPDERSINPPDVITISPDGKEFSVNLDGMEIGRMYRFEYQGDSYAVKKRASGAIALYEVIMPRDWPRLVLLTLMCILRGRQRPRLVRLRCR